MNLKLVNNDIQDMIHKAGEGIGAAVQLCLQFLKSRSEDRVVRLAANSPLAHAQRDGGL